MGKAPHLAILFGRLTKGQIGKGMGSGGIGLDTIKIKEIIAHYMRRPIAGRTHTYVDARLAKINRQQLVMAISNMQEMHITKTRDSIKVLRGLFGSKSSVREKHPPRSGNGHYLHKIATINHSAHFWKKLLFQLGA